MAPRTHTCGTDLVKAICPAVLHIVVLHHLLFGKPCTMVCDSKTNRMDLNRLPGHSIYHKTRELKSVLQGAEVANHPLQNHSQQTGNRCPN